MEYIYIYIYNMVFFCNFGLSGSGLGSGSGRVLLKPAPDPEPPSCLIFKNPNLTLLFRGLGKTWPIGVGSSRVPTSWGGVCHSYYLLIKWLIYRKYIRNERKCFVLFFDFIFVFGLVQGRQSEIWKAKKNFWAWQTHVKLRRRQKCM